MNWYKKAQDISSQYEKLMKDPASSIEITGSGVSQVLNIPGSTKSITAKELLEHVKRRLASVLTSNKIHVIDTSPIPQSNAQGLAISHEPGKIHVDVAKIFNSAKGALPPTAQLDGAKTDPDVINGIVDRIAYWIEGELTETVAHESQHGIDYVGAYEKGLPFTSVQESPGDRFGKQIRQRYFQEPAIFNQ